MTKQNIWRKENSIWSTETDRTGPRESRVWPFMASTHPSPDEVEQGIGRGHDGPPSQMVALHIRPHARFDDDDEQDADHYGDEGGPQVVGDGQDANPTARLRLHRRQTRHQTTPTDRRGGGGGGGHTAV